MIGLTSLRAVDAITSCGPLQPQTAHTMPTAVSVDELREEELEQNASQQAEMTNEAMAASAQLKEHEEQEATIVDPIDESAEGEVALESENAAASATAAETNAKKVEEDWDMTVKVRA